MVAKQVEAESTCSCPQLRFSADLLTNNLDTQRNLEAKEYRRRLKTTLKRSCQLKEKHPMQGTCSSRDWSEVIAFWLPPLPGQGAPGPCREPPDSVQESGRSRLHPHSEQHIHSCSAKCQPRDCQRDRGTLSPKMIRDRIWVRQRQTAFSCDCGGLLAFWKGGVHGEPDSDSGLQWRYHRETF